MNQTRKTIRPVTKDKRDWGLLLLIVALFLFVAAMFAGGERGSRTQASKIQPVNKIQLNEINRYLKDAALREELQKRETEAENEMADPIGEVEPESGSEDVNQFSLDQENHGQEVLRDLEGRNKKPGRPMTPDQRVNAKLERDRYVREDEKARDAEFVRQFIQNARKQGVNVQLNENLDVTGLEVGTPPDEPIRVPQSVPRSSK